jgi:hypothetical protein
VRVYFDTGVFIDYLSKRGNTILRTSDRRGRAPAQLATDAERLFELVRRSHIGATSCLTYYEVEEAGGTSPHGHEGMQLRIDLAPPGC